ncbi:hypothetical protein [Chitinophaga varians]|uniref:hypothetical protein n=1 Tax=Chitinophaga varians TaxID=2202339 RepID=UPI00165EFB6D|nr:hypothetical protein [Chitinophaga varians]MBC9914957.1 hypothetical protein [Chitinophaga varians]
MDHQDTSEKHHKFLMEIHFSGKVYYTVQGADMSDGSYDDKWLIDAANNILLFVSPDDLYAAILQMDEPFDKIEMQTWAVERLGDYEPYAVLDLDLLENAGLQPVSWELLRDIYTTLGLVKDYVIQVDDQPMVLLFEEGVIWYFIDYLGDYVVWGKKRPAKIGIDTQTLFPVLKTLYTQLSEKIKIHA